MATIRKDVFTEDAAAPLQHVFSQAIITKKKVYCSGSIGLDKSTRTLVEGGVKPETVRYASVSWCPERRIVHGLSIGGLLMT